MRLEHIGAGSNARVLGAIAGAILAAWGLMALVGAQDGQVASARGRESGQCPLVGTWVGTNTSGGHFYETVAPSWRSGEIHWVVTPTNNDATLGGLFPDAVSAGAIRGLAQRIGHNRWRAKGIEYAVEPGPPGATDRTVYVSVFEGDVYMPDCDTQEAVVDVSYYFADEDGNLAADADGDGIPEGEPDIRVEGAEFTFERLTLD